MDQLALLDRPCEIKGCPRQAQHLHEWAPRAFFPFDWEQWPQSWLCSEHHLQWHTTLTPGMTLERQLAAIIHASDELERSLAWRRERRTAQSA